MLQVPFGEIAAVRDYLKIDGQVSKPKRFHPARPVDGLECKRSEVSGNRLWGLFKELTNGEPDAFFEHCFVHNYFPLALLSGTGLNITPADLKVVIFYP
jgi:single-strand selective monofunctional uracil DNA glycosylase